MTQSRKSKTSSRSKKKGARSDLVSDQWIDPATGEVVAEWFGFSGGPKGFPTASPIAMAGDGGRRTGGRSAAFNPTGLTISVTFPDPEPGSFYAPNPFYGWEGVVHNDFVEAAKAERKTERKERAKRKRERKAIKAAFRNRLVGQARQKAEVEGIAFNDALGLVAAEHRHMVEYLGTKLPKGAIKIFNTAVSGFHGVEGPRRPSPVDARTPDPPIGRRATGPSPDASMSKRFAGDGLTPPRPKVLDVIADGKVYTLQPGGRKGCLVVPTKQFGTDEPGVVDGPDRLIGRVSSPVHAGEAIDCLDHARMSMTTHPRRPIGTMPDPQYLRKEDRRK
jgi:hypothetical protein